MVGDGLMGGIDISHLARPVRLSGTWAVALLVEPNSNLLRKIFGGPGLSASGDLIAPRLQQSQACKRLLIGADGPNV
jgi:hypothetical protein